MNMFGENTAMTLQDIKKTKGYDGWTDAHTDNVKTVYPPQTKFAGGINTNEIYKCINILYYKLIMSVCAICKKVKANKKLCL